MVSVILMQPQTAGNVGAIARIMKNFGTKDLYLIDPLCDPRSEESRNRAKHAQDVIDGLKIIKLGDLKKFDTIIATTSQIGTEYNLPRIPVTPQELCVMLAKRSQKVGLLFGRESKGLTNEELKQADFTVTIPSEKKYPTLNLSHSVAIILYELFKERVSESVLAKISPLSRSEREALNNLFDKTIDSMPFASEERRQTQRVMWKKILGRSFLTKREAAVVMGFLRKINKK